MRTDLPQGVPAKQVDAVQGDAFAVMPGYTRIVAIRRAGAWVGWVQVRSIPSLWCGRDDGHGMGCADRNCRECADNVRTAQQRGFTFMEWDWSQSHGGK